MPPKKRYQWTESGINSEDNRPSRSQKKRESTALQELGEELALLSPSQLAAMSLSKATKDALLEWQKLSSHEGKRRQMQYIGRLMREEDDPVSIREALEKIRLGHSRETVLFRRTEQLRDKLMLASPSELETLLTPFASERQNLKDLVMRARNERDNGLPPHAFRTLFRKLRELS